MMRYWKPCVFAGVAALLVTPGTEWQVNRRRLAEFRHRCDRIGASLEALPSQSMALGAVTTLGSTQDGIRRLATGTLPSHDPTMERLLLRFCGTLGADNAFVLDRAGIVVGNAQEPNPTLPAANLGLRPYFREAMQGRSNSYAALGARSGERGLYVAAPVARLGEGAPVGVVVAKMGFQEVDDLFQGETGSFALVSPEGVVFASNVPEWLYRVEGGAAQAALARQAPRTALAFAGSTPAVLAKDERFRTAVERPIEWQDSGGAWKLIGLADPDTLFGTLDRVLLSAMVFLLAFLAGAVWLERRRRVQEANRHQADLAAILVEGKEKAEQSAKAKAAFLANLSHEIRTPLNAIVGMAHLALRSDPAPDPRGALGRILAAADHLLGILNGVLDASKLEAGKLELEQVDFQLATVLDKVQGLLGQQAAAKGLGFECSVDPGVPAWLTGDPGRLGQVLINFADNAIKFTEKGSVQVRVDLLEDAASDVKLRFAVRDTGIGLRRGEQARVFRSFQQADPSTARTHGGTGLGLAICKDLVDLMGGELGVVSEPGRGSTFWFELRLGRGASPGAAEPPEQLPSGIPGLDVASGLKRVLGRKAVYLGLLRSLGAGQGMIPAQIRMALEAGDRVAAERLAHSVKGLLGSLGAGTLEQWAERLEGAIRQGRSPETLDSLVDGLEIRMAELARQLSGWLALGAGEGAPGNETAAGERETVLVVDDSPDNLAVMAGLLEGLYRVRLAGSGPQGLRCALEEPKPSLILLDVMMPGSDGYEVMRRLKMDPRTRDIPVIFLTGRSRPEDEQRGLELGAVDYLAKPVSPPILLSRVNNHLKLKGARDFLKSQNLYLELEIARRTREVTAIQDVTIQAMASMAETRDNETGAHIRRTQQYVRLLAQELRSHPKFRAYLTEANLDLIFKSAPLHDIGKVGIPDSILQKPGRLTPEEFEIMKRHTTLGREAIEAAERQLGTPVPFLAIAKEIAEGHQEKWDGSGYPAGLKGEAIPIPARLMAVADVYDALISKRVYKAALSHEVAMKIMSNGRGSHFDPDILDAFLAIAESFREVALRFQDAAPELAGREG